MGKMHGGIAKCGKVKGQTPKVERTSTVRKRNGRVRKRNQYARLLSKVKTKGRMPGPNNNALRIEREVARDEAKKLAEEMTAAKIEALAQQGGKGGEGGGGDGGEGGGKKKK